MASILLIDDEEIIRRRLGKLLTMDGYEVFLADDGQKGLDIFEKEYPQIVLVDIKMPGMDGIEVLSAVKKISPQTEVIVITGHGGMETSIEALRKDAFDYITKPINYDELEISIKRALEKQRMLIENRQMLRELQISKDSFHSIVENDSNGIVVTYKNGTICFVNPAARKLFNRENDELVGELFGIPITVSDTAMEVNIVRKGDTMGVGDMQAIETNWEGESAYLILIRDITDRKMYEESLIKTASLIKTTAELKKLDEMKSEFIAVASHELRTPLTSIKNAVDIILKGKAGAITDGQGKFLFMAQRNINRLATLINDMLNISKIESGKMNYEYAQINIRDITGNVINTLQPLANKKSIALNRHISPDLPVIFGDVDKIEQVLINLAGNAIKFTPEQGAVTIDVHQDEAVSDMPEEAMGYVEISVADTGIGIPAEHQKHLFEKFYQAKHSLERQEEGGTGLGLAICKGIIDGHKGKIWYESTEGKGSTFHFSLPVFSPQTVGATVLEKMALASLNSPLYSLSLVSQR